MFVEEFVFGFGFDCNLGTWCDNYLICLYYLVLIVWLVINKFNYIQMH